jgi:hypothetical protein
MLAVMLAWPRATHNTTPDVPEPIVAAYQEYNPLYESLFAPLVDEARRGWEDTYQATAGLASAGQDVLNDANRVLLCTWSSDTSACAGDEHVPMH